jgi:hypothetical protein
MEARMIRSCFALLITLVAGLGAACGGQIGIGTLAAEKDGGAPPPGGGSSGSSATPEGSTPTLPTSCGGQSGVQVLLDVATTGDEGVTDFFGDGTDVFAGVNYIGDFRAGRITKLPSDNPRAAIVDLSPAYVRGVAPAHDRVFFDMTPDVSDGTLGVAPRTGGTPTTADISAGAMLITTHPLRAEAFFVVTTDAGGVHQEVRVWNPPASPSTVMILPAQLTVRSLSASATTLAVLVEDTSSFQPSFRILAPKPTAPANPEAIVSSIDAPMVSNVVADGSGSVFVGVGDSDGKLSVLRFDGTNMQLSQGANLGSVTVTPTEGARIEMDDTHVYLAYGTRAACDKSPCTAPLTVVRVKKDRPSTTAAPVKVKELTGAAPDEIGYRSFNVDSCWFTWYDQAKRTLSRQPKGSL